MDKAREKNLSGSSGTKIRRKKYLVDRKFQSRMIISMVLLVIGAVMLSGILSYLIALQLEKQDSRKLYGSRLEVQEGIVLVERMMVVKPVILKYIFVGGFFSIIITLILMVFYSHRLAGPVYHLERHLEEMIAGDYSRKLRFRRNDEFRQLADSINRLQDKLMKTEVKDDGNT